ncbi:MAG: heme NO-binding domain-containing protein [Elusimicrobia bacterium]|nr:heme NO-binding domain-containing protein [Elusimicrobiota bacterium]
MKGVIVIALKELVVEKFGQDRWEAILKGAGIDQEPMLTAISDVDDMTVMNVVKSLCEVLNVTLQQAADVFGDYWVNVYGKKMYEVYYARAKNAKEFLKNMDSVHVISTKSMPNAKPPRFKYEDKDDKTMIMHYSSHRGMIDFMVGLIKGVGKYYGEKLKVNKLDESKVEIIFP